MGIIGSRATTILVLLTTTLAVPAVVGRVFAEEIGKYPVLSIALLLMYEIALIVLGLLTDAWRQVRSRWVDRLANHLDKTLTNYLSGSRRRYLAWLCFQCRDFDVKGLSTQGAGTLELDRVFVDLMLEPTPVHATSPDPIRTAEVIPRGRAQLFDFMSAAAFGNHGFAIIGPPGSGKSTLLKKLTLHVAAHRRPRFRHPLPLLLFLRDSASSIQADSTHYSLEDAAKTHLQRLRGPALPEGWLTAQLEAGRCLVLLDGLDEAGSDDIRRSVAAWVELQIAAYGKSRFVVTSRPYGYKRNPIAGLTVLEVLPFTRAQVGRFIENWYLANEIRAAGRRDAGSEAAAALGAADLAQRLAVTPALHALSVNPLLLTMIATVHRFRSSLPGRRVELYREICEVFLGKRQEARGVAMGLTPSQRQSVLQPLAFHMMLQERREITTREAVDVIDRQLRRVGLGVAVDVGANFLRDVENSSGLLLEREAGTWGFAHLAFQEYLAAAHAADSSLEDVLVRHTAAPWWHEVLRLYCALRDATRIVEASVARGTNVDALMLAVDCVEEARDVDEAWRARINELLRVNAENRTGGDAFQLAVETLIRRRVRAFIPIEDQVLVDPTYITNAEYQLFLDETFGRPWRSGHATEPAFSAGEALSPATGMTHESAVRFCSWISSKGSSSGSRLPMKGEVERAGVGGPSASGPGWWLDDGTISTGREDLVIELDVGGIRNALRAVDLLDVCIDVAAGMSRFGRTSGLQLVISELQRARSVIEDIGEPNVLLTVDFQDIAEQVATLVHEYRDADSQAPIVVEVLAYLVGQLSNPQFFPSLPEETVESSVRRYRGSFRPTATLAMSLPVFSGRRLMNPAQVVPVIATCMLEALRRSSQSVLAGLHVRCCLEGGYLLSAITRDPGEVARMIAGLRAFALRYGLLNTLRALVHLRQFGRDSKRGGLGSVTTELLVLRARALGHVRATERLRLVRQADS